VVEGGVQDLHGHHHFIGQTMITRNDKLEVFENFRIDRDLPKFKSAKETSVIESKFSISQDASVVLDSVGFNVVGRSGSIGVVGPDYADHEEDSKNFQEDLGRVKVWAAQRMFQKQDGAAPKKGFWGSLLARFKPQPQPTKPDAAKISIEEFFLSVKASTHELSVIKERAAGYEKAMADAAKSGQTALYERLVVGLNAYAKETHLIAIGMTKYIEEADIVRFYKQSKKGLRLDWICNYIRTVPTEIIDKKVRADALGVFDNYAVLHYDPQAKSFAETEREISARKDPILFGLIKGRRQLYFVGDWTDELCDLTLDQIADVLGKDVVHEIATTANSTWGVQS
jgi:hypothetical protein